MRAEGELTALLLNILDEDGWTATAFHLIHKQKDIAFWMCSGWMFFEMESPTYKPKLGFWNKRKLWKKAKAKWTPLRAEATQASMALRILKEAK